jgi:hypothetical protein
MLKIENVSKKFPAGNYGVSDVESIATAMLSCGRDPSSFTTRLRRFRARHPLRCDRPCFLRKNSSGAAPIDPSPRLFQVGLRAPGRAVPP